MKFTQMVTGFFVLLCATAYANQKTKTATIEKLSKYCQKPQVRVVLNENDLSKLNSANEVFASAKLCRTKNQSGECVIEDIVQDSIFDAMKLRNQDAFIASNTASINDSMGIISAFQGLVNRSTNCLVVRRDGKIVAIRYMNEIRRKQ